MISKMAINYGKTARGYYDLHCHTKASDGRLPIEKLLRVAKKQKLKGFCVTDHDILESSAKANSVSTDKREII
ncbi:unnamed protein product [marine sediment metagenome]|uniref:Polymerase/histidinol phosphatase N-terminal domain-containing protein n=1 Tax=marine sediment metagenome TaxID=412755 RepID=X1Q3M6_9ZZZZ